MITSTLFRSFLSTLLVSLSIFSFVSVASAETYVPPSGPPPNFNADPPIHTGSTGQAKYLLEELEPYTIGAFGFVSEWVTTFIVDALDVISENVSARGNGVLATAFCLGASGDIENAQNSPNTWLNNPLFDCVTAEDGWGGGGGETNLPDGSDWNQLLWWDTVLSQWIPLPGSRITSNGNLVSLILGDLDNNSPQPPYNIQFRGSIALTADDTINNNADHMITVANQGILIQSDETELRLVDGAPQPIGAVPVTVDTNGTLEWLSVADLGSFPEGTTTGQILYWNQVDGVWSLSSNGSGYLPGLGFAANYDSGQRFKYFDPNDECPKYQVIISKLVGGFKDLDCTNELRVDYDQSKVYVNSLSHDFESRVVCAGPEGDLNICDNLSTGTWIQDEAGLYEFEVPFGVYSIDVTVTGAGGGGGAGGQGMSLTNLVPAQIQDDVLAGGGGGGGGGRGETVTETVDVLPGQVYKVRVGEGGFGGCPWRYSPAAWWFAATDSCHPNHPNINGAWDNDVDPYGKEGEETSLYCLPGDDCDQNISVEANGGLGGGAGGTFYGFFDEEGEQAEESLLAMILVLDATGVVGGYGGQNGDGSLTAHFGSSGLVWANNGDGDMVGGVLSCGGTPRYRVIYGGGAGGFGSDGAGSGGGGANYFIPGNDDDICDTNPVSISSAGHGTAGSMGISSGQGGGGAGGGSSQKAWQLPLNSSYSFGYGGKGGKGADGKIHISW